MPKNRNEEATGSVIRRLLSRPPQPSGDWDTEVLSNGSSIRCRLWGHKMRLCPEDEVFFLFDEPEEVVGECSRRTCDYRERRFPDVE